MAEKSNSTVIALERAEQDARMLRDDAVPAHLKNAVYGGKEDRENARRYRYPHDFGGYVEQQYLPDALKDRVYYEPKNNGYEASPAVKARAKKQGSGESQTRS